MKNFKRMQEESLIGGVLSGLAYAYGIKTWMVRVGYILSLILLEELFGGVPLLLGYFLLFVFVPEYEKDPENYKEICE